MESENFKRPRKLQQWSVVRAELKEKVELARESDDVLCINSEPQRCLTLPHPNPLRCSTALPSSHGHLFLSQHCSASGANVYSLYTFDPQEDRYKLERLECRVDCTTILSVPKHRVFVGFSPLMKLVVMSDMSRKLTPISEHRATRTILSLIFNRETDEVIAGGIGVLHRFGIAINHYKEELVPKPDFDVQITSDDWITQLELYTRKRQLVVLSNTGIYFISYRTNKLVHHLENHHETSMIRCCLHTPLDYIITGFKDGCIKVFTTVLYRGVHDFRGHTKPITALQIHATEPVLISASKDRSIRLWSLETLELFLRLDVDHDIESMGLIKSSHIFCVTKQNIEILSTNQFSSLFAMVESEVSLLSRSSCNGYSNRIMASALDGEIRILSPVDGTLLTMVYPMSSSKVWTQYIHNRFTDEIMALLDCGKVLVLDSSTNPCTPKQVLESSTTHEDVVLSISCIQMSRAVELQDDEVDDCLVFVGQTNGQIMLTSASHYHMNWPVQAHVGAVLSLTCSARKKPNVREVTPVPVTETDSGVDVHESEDETTDEQSNEMETDSSERNQVEDETGDSNKEKIQQETNENDNELTSLPSSVSITFFEKQSNKDPIEDFDHLLSAGTDEFIKIWEVFMHPRHPFEITLTCIVKVSCHSVPDVVRMTGRTIFFTAKNDFHLRAFRVWDEHHHQVLTHNDDEDHTELITGLDLNTDLQLCVTISKDRFMKVWSIDNTLIREMNFSHIPTAICFANDRGDVLIGMINHIFSFTIQNYLPVEFLHQSHLTHRHFDDDIWERSIPFNTESKPTLDTNTLNRSQVSLHKRMERSKYTFDENLILELLDKLGLERRFDSTTGAVIGPWDVEVRNRLKVSPLSSPLPDSSIRSIASVSSSRLESQRMKKLKEIEDAEVVDEVESGTVGTKESEIVKVETPVPSEVESEESATTKQEEEVETVSKDIPPEELEIEKGAEAGEVELKTEEPPRKPRPIIAPDGYIPNSEIRHLIGYRPPTPGKIIRKKKEKKPKYKMPSHLFSNSGRDLANPDKEPADNLAWEDAGERKPKPVVIPDKPAEPEEQIPMRGRLNSSFNEYSLKSNFKVDFSTAEIGYEKRASTRRASTGGHMHHTGHRGLKNYPRGAKGLKEQIAEEHVDPSEVRGHIDAFRAKAMRDPLQLLEEITRQRWYKGDRSERDPIKVLESLLETLESSPATTSIRILSYVGAMQETFLFQPSVLHQIISSIKHELEHTDSDVRITAIELLMKMGLAPESIYISLIKNLAHENENVRNAAEHALSVLTEIKNKGDLLEYFNRMGLLKQIAQDMEETLSSTALPKVSDDEVAKEAKSRLTNWRSKASVVPEDLRRERDSLYLTAVPSDTDKQKATNQRGPIHIPGKSGSGIVSIADEISWLEKKTPKSGFEIDRTRLNNRARLRASRSFRTTPPTGSKNSDRATPEIPYWAKGGYKAGNEEVELKRRRRVLLLLAETYAQRHQDDNDDDATEFETIDTPTTVTDKRKMVNLHAHVDIISDDSGFPNTDTEGSTITETAKAAPVRALSPVYSGSPPPEPEPIIEYYQPPPIVAKPPEQIKREVIDRKQVLNYSKALSQVREEIQRFDQNKKKVKRQRRLVSEQGEINELQSAYNQNQKQNMSQQMQQLADPLTNVSQMDPLRNMQFMDPMERFNQQNQDMQRGGMYSPYSGHSKMDQVFAQGADGRVTSPTGQRRRANAKETETFQQALNNGHRDFVQLTKSATEIFTKKLTREIKLEPIVYGKGRAGEAKCPSGTRVLNSVNWKKGDREPLYREKPLHARQGVDMLLKKKGNVEYGAFAMSWSTGKPATPLHLESSNPKPKVPKLDFGELNLPTPISSSSMKSGEKLKLNHRKVLPSIENEFEWDVRSLYYRPDTKKKQIDHETETKMDLMKQTYALERKRLYETRQTWEYPSLDIVTPYSNVNLTPSNSRSRFTNDVLNEYVGSHTQGNIIDING